MNYPVFFDKIESIKVKDPLAQILGAFVSGEYEITYLEVVKAAGHSCPTVAGAYIMVSEAIKVLYPQERAVRGNIKVEFQESVTQGVAGVIGNVISHITGATFESGFKGLDGKFARHSLMFFDADIDASVRFTRIDTGKSVDVNYNHTTIEASPQMMPLMQKLTKATATSQEIEKFGQLWQERVKRIFENLDKVVEVTVKVQ